VDRTAAIKFCWLVCMAALIVMSGCGEQGKAMLTPVDLLPDDDDISGWTRVGTYDEASDYDALYELINGDAEIFIDNGFVSAAFQEYTSGGLGVELRIYDQGSGTNAIAVYDIVATGIGIAWDGAGTEARIDESGLASYTVEFWQRNFFVQVIVEEKTDEALNTAKLFASDVSSEIR
jgi:hypothetical protein